MFMKKSVKRMLTVCGAAAMMLSAAQITAFADGDVKEVSLHLPTVYDLPDAPMVEDAINQITEEKNKAFILIHPHHQVIMAAVQPSVHR